MGMYCDDGGDEKVDLEKYTFSASLNAKKMFRGMPYVCRYVWMWPSLVPEQSNGFYCYSVFNVLHHRSVLGE
jgi:hypothetical protein